MGFDLLEATTRELDKLLGEPEQATRPLYSALVRRRCSATTATACCGWPPGTRTSPAFTWARQVTGESPGAMTLISPDKLAERARTYTTYAAGRTRPANRDLLKTPGRRPRVDCEFHMRHQTLRWARTRSSTIRRPCSARRVRWPSGCGLIGSGTDSPTSPCSAPTCGHSPRSSRSSREAERWGSTRGKSVDRRRVWC